MILFIKKSPLWCKPGRRFFRSQCEDGFLTHLELPAKPPPRAAWDTNSELLSPAPRRKLWKNLPTSQYHLERCLPQSTSLTLGSPLQACIRCGNIVPLTPLHQPVTTAASLRVGPVWEHCKQNGCTIFLCSGNISISFNTTIKLHFVQIDLKSSPARQHMSHVWTTHVPTANWAHLVAGYVELTKPKIKNKKLQIF